MKSLVNRLKATCTAPTESREQRDLCNLHREPFYYRSLLSINQ